MRRRYTREIKKDVETFQICTDTIIRHVEDIGRMVDEFSSFARMPAPSLKPEDLVKIVEQAVFLQRTARPEIAFEMHFDARPMPLTCDARLISQALTNIVKNATESIEARIAEGEKDPPARIAVSVCDTGEQVVVTVEDNGKGLPQQGRERLTEPYVTTRTKGTGLGLAIVKKIMEDHRGELILEDGDPIGARVNLVFATEARTAMRPAQTVPSVELSTVTHGA